MQTMRDKWTDERLDDLNAKVDRGFERIGAEMQALRAEMNTRFDAMDRKFDAVDRKFDAQSRMMLWFAGALIVAIVASNLAIVGAIFASAGEGAGLDLAIVRELTGAMGGTAGVENLAAGGARFEIELPQAAENPL